MQNEEHFERFRAEKKKQKQKQPLYLTRAFCIDDF